ncbi:MAG: Ppx/GppA family phosphatase [Actinobacteria bacterium]|nr:MAG: Ppx/GppA family phosphatase [Actinomycetota bacterium]
MIKAGIDIGTNSTRLIVADFKDGSYKTLHREARVTRLGQDVDKTSRLASEAIARTVEVIKDYTRIADKLGAGVIRATTTSAARDAKNTGDFIDLVKAKTGIELEVLSPEKEAKLSFLGATYSTLPSSLSTLVMDIGGGSTELILGSPRHVKFSFSKNIGCVRLYELFIENDPPISSEIEAIRNYVRDIYSKEINQIKKTGDFQLIGTAGTITTLAAINLGLKEYDPSIVHGSLLSKEKIDEILKQFLSMTLKQRKEIPVMEPGRADVIVAGTTIASTLLETLSVKKLIVSEADILDGIILDVPEGGLEPPHHKGNGF